MKKVIVIPARLESKRFPRKVLIDLNGKTLIERVYHNSLEADISEVFIATDSKEIKEKCIEFTKNIIMTSEKHISGTDRIAEAVKNIDCDIVINVQADEPFINKETINSLLKCFDDKKVSMASVMEPIVSNSKLNDPNYVKVKVDKLKNAIFFSRYPELREKSKWLNKNSNFKNNLYIHQGIYGFKKEFLLKFSNMKPTYFEKTEKLEQLRVLENGFNIKMIESKFQSIGIDTLDDYKEALKFLKNEFGRTI